LEFHASDANLTDEQKKISAKLMRVNHTGEVCAQALYLGQALVEKDLDIKTELNQSAKEELDHLAWTQQRIDELGGRTSLLNPVFYAGSFAIGVIAGLSGTKRSLGFLQETERQVEAHLTEHLDRVSSEDERSRAMIVQMREEERSHADRAERLGAEPLPKPVRVMMRLMSKAMTQSTFRI
jgi:ubiquinone biosynthesis monooxygenase Coq7